jgi:hypothetical protein
MSYGNIPYGTGSYKYGSSDKPVFTSANHRYCLHYGVTAEQGPGWSKREGENWVWPESQAAIITISNGVYREEIVYDENDGLPYIIDTRDGPADSGMVKSWKDKSDPYTAGSGTVISWEILFGEHIGELEQYFVDHMETFLNIRPVDVAKANTDGYDANGFPLDLKINFSLFKDGFLDSYADAVDVPIKRDIIVAREERGNALQIGLRGTSAEFRLRKIETYLKVSDLPHTATNLSEQDFQVSFSNCLIWLSRDSGLVNRVTGQLLSGSHTVINGPAIANDGMTILTPVSLLNSGPDIGTILLWHKEGYSIQGITLTEYGRDHQWRLSYVRSGSGSAIPSNIILPVGDVSDPRIVNEVLSDEAIENYFDNIVNHKGDVYLP